jgi:hypothetical protein
MSIELMTLAWKTRLSTSQKMVLLVMCDRANDEGGSLYPSVPYVAKRSSMSERQVQRTLREFEDMRLLRVIANENGGAPGKSRHYLLSVPTLRALAATGDTESPASSETRTGDKDDPGRVTTTTSTGDAGTTQSTIDPSGNPSEDSPGASKLADDPPGKADEAPEVRKPLSAKELAELESLDHQMVHDWFIIRKDKGSKHFTVSDLKALKTQAGKANFTLSEAIQTAVDNQWRGFRATWVPRIDSRSMSGGSGHSIHDLSGMVYGKRPGEGDIPS